MRCSTPRRIIHSWDSAPSITSSFVWRSIRGLLYSFWIWPIIPPPACFNFNLAQSGRRLWQTALTNHADASFIFHKTILPISLCSYLIESKQKLETDPPYHWPPWPRCRTSSIIWCFLRSCQVHKMQILTTRTMTSLRGSFTLRQRCKILLAPVKPLLGIQFEPRFTIVDHFISSVISRSRPLWTAFEISSIINGLSCTFQNRTPLWSSDEVSGMPDLRGLECD